MGEADLLSKGDGKGEAMRRGGELKASLAVSSPSLRPEIRRLGRGRRVEGGGGGGSGAVHWGGMGRADTRFSVS